MLFDRWSEVRAWVSPLNKPQPMGQFPGGFLTGISMPDKWQEYKQRFPFKGADIAVRAVRATYPALVRGRADGVIPRVDGRGAPLNRDGLGEATVIPECAKPGVAGKDMRAGGSWRTGDL